MSLGTPRALSLTVALGLAALALTPLGGCAGRERGPSVRAGEGMAVSGYDPATVDEHRAAMHELPLADAPR